MSRTRITQVLLVIGVIVVWFLAGKRVIEYTGNVDDQPENSQALLRDRVEIPVKINASHRIFEYASPRRNPFLRADNPEPVLNQPMSSVPPPSVQVYVPFTGEGILYTKDSPLAMVTADDGRFLFLSKSDSLLGFAIDRITPDSVYIIQPNGLEQAVGLSR